MLPSIFGENLFDDSLSDFFGFGRMMPQVGNELYGKHAKNLMKTDVRELDGSYELDVDLPGFKKDEVTVDLQDGYLTAYGIYAYNFRFKKAAFAIILLIMTMPTQVSALGFLQLITKMGLKNSFIPLILPSIAAPTVFFFMKQYLDASLPMEIVEAARIDGAGEFYTFNKIVLPIMKPALAVQAIFSFVASWNNYFIPALVLDSADKKTLPILIAQLRSADFLKFDMGKVYMMVAIAILPVIIVYLLLSKFIVRGVALGGVKG